MKIDSDFLLSLFEDGELDATDLKIIRAMRDDRTELTQAAIARAAGVDRGTMRYRLTKIRDVIQRAAE